MKLKDPVSGLTHLVGAGLSIAAIVILTIWAVRFGNVWHVVSFAIFGASLFLLYTASSLYHLLPVSERITRALKRVDHMMIYVLIAGTYTPVCLVALRGAWGWSLFGVIWGLVIVGVALKAFWLDAPRWLSTVFYASMGWLAVVAFIPIIQSIPTGGLLWLLGGGIFYTIGAVIYGLKRPRLFPDVFGFHEVFHLFVMLGSLSHFVLMIRYILYLG